MARSYGMDLNKLMEIVAQSTGQCFVADKWNFVMTNWPHLSVMGKQDVKLCLEAAKEKNISMKLLETCFGGDWENSRT